MHLMMNNKYKYELWIVKQKQGLTKWNRKMNEPGVDHKDR